MAIIKRNNNGTGNANNSPKDKGKGRKKQTNFGQRFNFSEKAQDKLKQTQIAQKLKQAQEKRENRNIKKTISSAAGAAGGPLAKIATKAMLNTSAGDRYIDAYKKGFTPADKMANVTREMKKDLNKIKIIAIVGSNLLVILGIILIVSFFFKTADSQIFSNQNGGTVLSENYIGDDKVVNVFANYPGLYEKIVDVANKVGDKYKIEIDKYLIIATLVEPISNQLIIPVEDNSCGEDKCYYFNGESKTWSEFITAWADQAELLSKMQIITYTNPESPEKVSCKTENTMEQIANNDMEARKKYAFWWLNPVEWFRGFKDATEAELNAVCTQTPSGKTKVPTVTTQSTLIGDYYLTNNKNHEYEFIKDEDSGGVYFWNLVNKNGFLYQYLKDYLSDEYKDDEDKNYEINKAKIIEIANGIYSYYDTIKKTCDGRRVISSDIKTIKVYNPPEKQSRYGVPEYEEVDFEEQYVGGVMLAEFHSGGIEGLKAFAILVRSEAIATVGLDGSGTIENSSNVQNYDPTYSPEKYPKIAEAVEATRGMVLSKYKNPAVWHTEYDNFCPTKTTLDNGFYYLPKGQQSLPINPAKYKEITGSIFMDPNSNVFDCPCFNSLDEMPMDVFDEKRTKYSLSNTEPPTELAGNPPQVTKAACWNLNGKTHTVDGQTLYGWVYHATGGHGRGASQHGIKYFDAFGYSQDAILRLFFPGAQVRILSSSLLNNKCATIDYYTGEIDEGGSGGASYGSSEYTGGNYTDVIGGQPLNKPIGDALADKGHTIDDLNNCINERVEKAGRGTREGVVEAGVALIQCTMDLTGGYTYPYDHYGGDVLASNPDIVNKYGINSKWGVPGGSCPKGNCRLGLNCATFVRWSMCNGGMKLCDRGSRAAHEMYHTTYFPEAIKIKLSPGFQVLAGNTSISSSAEAFDNIKPGDMLYSENYPRDPNAKDHGNHVMLVIGKTDDSVTIAENGRNTRVISKQSFLTTTNKSYGVLLLDDYYANSNNLSGLS